MSHHIGINSAKIIKFDKLQYLLSACTIIVGMQNSGKTMLLRALVEKLMRTYGDEIYRYYVISNTAQFSEHYDFTDYQYGVNAGIMKRLIQKQKVLKIMSKKDQRIRCPKIVVILDDFIGDLRPNSKESAIIDKYASMGRHFGISLICLTQHLTKLSPVVRNNSTYIFTTVVPQSVITDGIFPLQNDYTDKRKLWTDYNKITREYEYSFMCVQKMYPRLPNVTFVEGCPMVNFIDPEYNIQSLEPNCEEDIKQLESTLRQAVLDAEQEQQDSVLEKMAALELEENEGDSNNPGDN